MKVIIDIPKKEYDIIKNYKSFMPWAEGLIKKGVAIPEGATNYDVLKAVFGKITTFRIKDSMEYEKGFELWFSAPYKGVEE